MAPLNMITNGYQVSVTGGSSASLTYDANGNMLTDQNGNTYSWDCENRLIEIVYPGSGNNSQFVYDGYGRNVEILEYSGGSLTSTKQFVWCQDLMQSELPSEVRTAAGGIAEQFFPLGETISGTSYFYTRDKLGSVREMSNSAGAIQAQMTYDPYGKVSQIQGSISSDLQYSGYYLHATSGLNLTRTRAYSASQGRFIQRDKIGETNGANLFFYALNNPISFFDPSGLQAGSGSGASGGSSLGNFGTNTLGQPAQNTTPTPPAPKPPPPPPPPPDPLAPYRDCSRTCNDGKPCVKVTRAVFGTICVCPEDQILNPQSPGFNAAVAAAAGITYSPSEGQAGGGGSQKNQNNLINNIINFGQQVLQNMK